MISKIVVNVIPHNQQRYNTCGDWQFKDDTLQIDVSDTGDEFMNFLIARHEQDEAMLCLRRGISQKEVDDWDMSHEDTGTDDFSADMDAPYHQSHCDALSAEWVMASLLGVNWKEYGQRLESAGWTGHKAVSA